MLIVRETIALSELKGVRHIQVGFFGLILCPSQHFFSHVGTGIPGLNQY